MDIIQMMTLRPFFEIQLERETHTLKRSNPC
jgi:hypothetical protein